MDAHTELSIMDAIAKLEYILKQQKYLVNEDLWNMVRQAKHYLHVAEADLKPRNKR